MILYHCVSILNERVINGQFFWVKYYYIYERCFLLKKFTSTVSILPKLCWLIYAWAMPNSVGLIFFSFWKYVLIVVCIWPQLHDWMYEY